MEFKDKVCVVTGSTSGIGFALAKYLLEHGAKVYVSGRTPEHMENAKAAFAQYGDKVSFELIDFCSYRRAEEYFSGIAEENGGVDYLFANAGGGTVNRFEDITWDMWEDVFGSNVFGAIAAIKGILPSMKRRKAGHILITASLAGYSVNPYQASYVATKHAVYGLAQSLSYELEDDNISVQAICPGFVRTPIFTRNGEPEEAIPPQCIPVEQAVEEIMAGIEAGSVTINVCNEARAYYEALRKDPDYCDSELRNLAKFYSMQL